MKNAVLKRKTALNRLNESKVLAADARNNITLQPLFFARSSQLDAVYSEFQSAHNVVIGLLEEEEDFINQDKIRFEADSAYYEVKSVVNELTALNAPVVPAVPPPLLNPVSNMTLSKIIIPIFDGNIDDWPRYFDLFNTMVHNNSHLSKIEKFHYLLTSLAKEPLAIVKNLTITESNYLIVYDILKQRYQNKRHLATNYYKHLYNAIPIQKPSAFEVKHLADIFKENVAALEALNFPVDHWDFLLFNLLLNKLDHKTRTEFEMKFSSIELPSYDDLIDFLEHYGRALESVQSLSSNVTKPPIIKPHFVASPKRSTVLKTELSSHFEKCALCKGAHVLYRCSSFLEKSPSERFSIVKQYNLCINCLGVNHVVRNCPSKNFCRSCERNHHTLLHLKSNESLQKNNVNLKVIGRPSQTIVKNENMSDNTENASTKIDVLTSAVPKVSQTILLSTAEVDIQTGSGRYQKVRVLFDSGSMTNFITESCVNRLGLNRRRVTVPIEGINNISAVCSNGITQCTVKPCGLSEPVFDFEAIILRKICSDQPKFSFDINNLSYIQGLKLADSTCNVPGAIDLLIGAELLPYIIKSNKRCGTQNQPVALDTVFGWVLQGKTSFNISLHTSLSAFVDLPLENTLQKFWEVENINTPRFLSDEDKQCEESFKKYVSRLETGRFSVALPFKKMDLNFGDTYSSSRRRFLHLESRLRKNVSLYSEYKCFMQNYIDAGHMSLVPTSDQRSLNSYYIPHHYILKPGSTSTPLRVVFDASSKGSQGVSLNDTLLVGPKLQKDIASILLKFRCFAVAFVCDIQQMYRQIMIQPSHQNFQRILWRPSDIEPLQEYNLNTVTYGVASSPYLALRTLKELADTERHNFPQAASALENNLYIDDIVCGAQSLDSALHLQKEVIDLLRKGCFHLKKWASNNGQILQNVPASDRQISISFDNEEPAFIKVLGLEWNPLVDFFSFKYVDRPITCSKRHILSEITRIYDPLGFLTPITLFAKCLMQKLWAARVEWDETPCDSIVSSWNQFRSELGYLSTINIPRSFCWTEGDIVELHGFSDASQVGYGAVIYLKFIHLSGESSINLVCARSRVAPIKTVSLPRLELCAAVLLSDLISFVRESITSEFSISTSFAWVDSQVVLSWLSSYPNRWKTFVANRVSHIQENSLIFWNYVPSSENPADCISRGQTPCQFVANVSWVSGPSWLQTFDKDQTSQAPPISETEMSSVNVEEIKSVLHADAQVELHPLKELLNRFSSLTKIQRIVAYMSRFIIRHHRGILSPAELEESLLKLVKFTQQECFGDLIGLLKSNKTLPKCYRKLAIFMDEEGFLRVGGRLQNAQLNFEIKHPILLPGNHRLTDLIIEFTHKNNLHPGYRTLHYLLVQRFWILSPRAAIYRCLSKCIRCFRCKPKSLSPKMADLPSFRLAECKAFTSVCVDYAGPFSLCLTKSRGVKSTKGYCALFVCCSTKAVHIELASDLSSEAFIAVFRRFVSRRGHCFEVHSDQGTNFVGAYRQLKELSQSACEKLTIQWHFNPPASPHFNGLAEAGVKSVKTHLHRVIGDQVLSYEEFYTLLTQIESVLNSRPLGALSSDPNDLQPLTPGHFLLIGPLNHNVPNPDLTALKLNRLNRYQLLQKMLADFWKRWHAEYLHTLLQRNKWCNDSINISVGTLVLIQNDSVPCFKWPMGRVIQVHPGPDRVVRVVSLKTSHGTLQRPVVKLCPLPINN